MQHSFLGAWLTSLLLALFVRPQTVQGASSSDDDTSVFCGPEDAVNSTSLRYTILSNQWGDDGSGLQCVTVDLGSSNDNYTSFNATWRWYENRTLVHSFPSVILNSEVMPIEVSNLTSLTVDASWAIVLSPSDEVETSATDLAEHDTVADVALDMFLDLDTEKSSNASEASTEIMVWQAAYGNLKPLGWDTVSAYPPTQELAGVNYTLYQGSNDNGQAVFSWVPTQNLSSLNTDLLPLVSYLSDGGYIPKDIYLGRVQFGSETMHSAEDQNVTFIVDHIEMNVNNEQWESDGSSNGNGSSGGSGSSGNQKGIAAIVRPSLSLLISVSVAYLAVW